MWKLVRCLKVIESSLNCKLQYLENNILLWPSCCCWMLTLYERILDHESMITHTHTHTHNHFMALWILSGTTRVRRYRKKHSPTHTHRGHQSSLSTFSIYYDPWHPLYSIHVLYSLFPESLSKFSLVYPLAWHPPLHTPCISSPNHCLLSLLPSAWWQK